MYLPSAVGRWYMRFARAFSSLDRYCCHLRRVFCHSVFLSCLLLLLCQFANPRYSSGRLVALLRASWRILKSFRLLNSQPSFLTGGAFGIRTLGDLKIYGRSMFNRPWSGPSLQVRVSNSGLRQGSHLIQGHQTYMYSPIRALSNRHLNH